MREVRGNSQDPDFENRGFEKIQFNPNGTIQETVEED